MARAGVEILTGTDTGDPYVLPGFALHDELALLVGAGLTPLEALRAATLTPARYFGLEGTLGAIEAGKTANLVMLDANPLDDIANTRKIASVVLQGKVLDRTRLDALMSQTAGAP
jgi:imidazolonepropionase-like amidohydrolase